MPEYVHYDQVVNYISRQRCLEDQQRKLENAHRRTVEITGNLPGNNLPSLDEETPEVHNF